MIKSLTRNNQLNNSDKTDSLLPRNVTTVWCRTGFFR